MVLGQKDRPGWAVCLTGPALDSIIVVAEAASVYPCIRTKGRAKMRHELFTEVVLRKDLPEKGLKKGDVATVVERHARPGAEDGYSLEIFNPTFPIRA